jgi:tRNA-2-methylthio-N6-dimethylallyladenosine synthase
MKYHIWTEGCQMNVADLQRAASALERLGYRAALDPADADVLAQHLRRAPERRDKAVGHLTSPPL